MLGLGCKLQSLKRKVGYGTTTMCVASCVEISTFGKINCAFDKGIFREGQNTIGKGTEAQDRLMKTKQKKKE